MLIRKKLNFMSISWLRMMSLSINLTTLDIGGAYFQGEAFKVSAPAWWLDMVAHVNIFLFSTIQSVSGWNEPRKRACDYKETYPGPCVLRANQKYLVV